MGVIDKLKSVIGGSKETEPAEESIRETPSHRCPSCGEEYFVNPDVEIDTCRGCGGTKVEAVRRVGPGD